METKTKFTTWLAKKLYLTNIGLYATIGTIMLLPPLLTKLGDVPQAPASLITYFIVAFLRATYESILIYEASVKTLSLPKMLFLSAVTASTLFLTAHFLKPKLGYFSIPVSIIIAMVIVGKLKAALWPSHERPGFFAELPAKLAVNKWGMYGFYVFLVGVTWFGYGKCSLSFTTTFATAYFIGMLFEESYNIRNVYNRSLTIKTTIAMIIWSACCATVCSASVWVLMGIFGASGQVATIASVIVLKLIQPLCSGKFLLEL
jgi:hypothetical protein